MGTAALIRSYRVRAGKSRSEVALQLGLNDAWYHDLEQNDDELAFTLTLFQAIELASILGVGLHDLMGQDAPLDQPIPLMDLPARIEAHVARNGISIEQFEEQVGWALRDVLQSPVKAAAESPIVFFQALAKHLGINWLSLIPAGAHEP
jgi:transcriptional regulator with XRE-family HTH domain